MAIQDLELTPEQLRASCDPESLGFETTADLPELVGSVGQDRAMAAIDFGLEMKTEGYNIFAAGPTGTGRNFAVSSRAQEAASDEPTPDDWCYVYNFHDPRQPRCLRLPAGEAARLREDIDELISTIRQEIPRSFESESYQERKENAIGDVQAERNRLLRQLDEEARSRGLMIQPTPVGLATVPLVDGSAMSRDFARSSMSSVYCILPARSSARSATRAPASWCRPVCASTGFTSPLEPVRNSASPPWSAIRREAAPGQSAEISVLRLKSVTPCALTL